MRYGMRVEPESLVGELLTHIDIDSEKNEIMLTTASGRVVKVYHDQDCCETVEIESMEGDWKSLVGKVLIEVEQKEFDKGDPPPNEYSESWTRTELRFCVGDATVISRWIGTSNGYYSEDVDFELISQTA